MMVVAQSIISSTESDNDTQVLKKKMITSFKDIDKNEFDFEVYPNPSLGVVSIRNTSSMVINGNVVDVTGRIVHHIQTINPHDIFSLNLDKGTYYLILMNENNEQKTKKIIVL